MSAATQPTARLRASLANAAFAVEDRVAIGTTEVARGALEVGKRSGEIVKWPFERLVWAFQEHLLWPLQDRADGWSQTTRAVGGGAVAFVALAACALGLLLASGGNGHSTTESAATPASPPPAQPAAVEKAAADPVLHGAPPVFKAKAALGTAKATGGGAKAAADASPASAAGAPSAAASTVGAGEPAGPAALAVARRFAGAFVLYEIGQKSTRSRAAFQATATAELARSLLRRPPRLPANVKVPKAKVVNVVAGPSHGGVFPVSVSLLRVGVTSELRLDMQKQDKGEAAAGSARPNQNLWRVTDVTG